jgi:2-phospho-L-lactate guanylyltransferase
MHADLPLATTVDGIADDADAAVAVIVPDHHDDGNPVLAIPSAAEFGFAYGPGSCARHIAEAERCGLEVRIVRDRALGFDVDDATDLRALEHGRETVAPKRRP